MATKEELESKFVTGYRITQEDYVQWINSSAFLSDPASAFTGLANAGSFKYFKAGAITSSVGTEKILIPFNMNIVKVEIFLGSVGVSSIDYKVFKNGDKSGNGIILGTIGEIPYDVVLVAPISLLTNDYLTIDCVSASSSQNLTLIFHYIKN